MTRAATTVCLGSALVGFAVACAAAPKIIVEGERYTITNARYRAVLDGSTGGLLSALTFERLPGEPIVTDQRIYTDFGIYPQRVAVSSGFEHQPEMSREERQGVLRVRASGYLTRDDDGEWRRRRIAYTAAYAFDDSPTIRVRCTVKPEFDAEGAPTFLAHVMTVTKYAEWFANTQDGLVCEDALDHSSRTWESRLEPLDRTRPFFGTLDGRDGAFVLFVARDAATIDACENIFFHDSGDGTTAPFFAWLSGFRAHPMLAGREWAIEYSLTVGRGGLVAARETAVRLAGSP